MAEFRYLNFDADEIWNAMQRAYIAAGGDILYPGDEKEIFLRGVLAICVGALSRVDAALSMATLKWATGDFLKIYGENRGCVYLDATSAKASARVTFRETGVAKTIPAGSALTADGVTTWLLDEDLAQTGAADTADVTLTCGVPGAGGNGMEAGTALRFVSGGDAVVSAVTLADSAGGADAEDEEIYRERIRNFGLAAVTTGAKDAYEAKTRAVSALIRDCQAVNTDAGEVTVYLLLDDGADAAAVIADVEDALNAIDARPLTDTVAVEEAEDAEYAITLSVEYSSLNVSAAEIEAVIEAWQKWQDGVIARAFNPDRLTAALYNAGVDRVTYAEGSGMDGSMEYTEIGDGKRCKGTVTVEN